MYSQNKKVLAGGWHVGSQTPIDDRLVFKDLEDLQNLGSGDMQAFRYYEGMRVWVLTLNKEYVWVESATGALATSYTYPTNTIVDNIHYSGRSFNFVESGFLTPAMQRAVLLDWMPDKTYITAELIRAISPITGKATVYRRVQSGISGSTFDITEVASWEEVSSVLQDCTFLSATDVQASEILQPHLSEITAFLSGSAVRNEFLYYTGTDVSTDHPRYIYYINQSGSLILLQEPSTQDLPELLPTEYVDKNLYHIEHWLGGPEGPGGNYTSRRVRQGDLKAAFTQGLQPLLISGTNIKTINGIPILGPGNIAISSDITIGTTPIASGANDRILFQSGGVVQQSSRLTYNGSTLEVQANGGLPTDVAIRVKNSANTLSFLQINGDGTYYLSSHGQPLVDSFSRIADGRMFMSKTLVNFIELNPSVMNRLYSPSNGWEVTGRLYIADGVKTWYYYQGTLQVGELVVTGGATNSFWISNGKAPTLNASYRHWYYSSDFLGTNGRASPTFRTEEGNVICLNKQDWSSVITVAGVIAKLQNLGL